VVVTSSWKRTGSAVACVQLVAVPVPVDVVVLVATVPVVVEAVEPQRPVLLTEEAGIRTRGSPDVIGTGIFPLESTVIDVQV
jgi:hypothetical protein